MDRGSYRTLFVKLSGVALGLVVMLGGAAMLTRNVGQYASAEKNIMSGPALASDLVILTDAGQQITGDPLEKSRLALEKLKIKRLEKLIGARSHIANSVNNAIERIEEQGSIPDALRENILTGLEQQLAENEKRLDGLEDYLATLSENITPSLTRYDKCDKDRLEKPSLSLRKKFIEAQTWI